MPLPHTQHTQYVQALLAAYRTSSLSTSEPIQEDEEAPPPASPVVFANLRNGEWYLPPHVWSGQCYFKVKGVGGWVGGCGGVGLGGEEGEEWEQAGCVTANYPPPPPPPSHPSTLLYVYKQSTDGHSGQWAFSSTRLNLHLALAAAKAGGAIVVDSTRRGKVGRWVGG